ncbi:MAG: helix-turn-helix transcriptional regulator [Pseudoxanthomonas sp.]
MASTATCDFAMPMHERIHADLYRCDAPDYPQPGLPEECATAPARIIASAQECGHGEHVRLRASPEAALQLIRSVGSAAIVVIPEGGWTVLVAMTGRPLLMADGIEWQLEPGRCLTWDRRLALVATADDAWFCLHGAEAAWLRACPGSALVRELFPVEDTCPPTLSERVAHLFDEIRTAPADESGLSWRIRDIVSDLHRTQLSLRNLLPRCPGRTHNRKRWTMLRLLRVRHVIASDQSVRANLPALSSRINCSCGHLSRIHRGVFGETPIEFAQRMRLRHALKLVAQTDLAFCDIAEATGFDSPSSFTRAFRQCHSMTPTQARASISRAVQAG